MIQDERYWPPTLQVINQLPTLIQVVVLEDLAAHFKMKTQDTIDRVTALQGWWVFSIQMSIHSFSFSICRFCQKKVEFTRPHGPWPIPIYRRKARWPASSTTEESSSISRKRSWRRWPSSSDSAAGSPSLSWPSRATSWSISLRNRRRRDALVVRKIGEGC